MDTLFGAVSVAVVLGRTAVTDSKLGTADLADDPIAGVLLTLGRARELIVVGLSSIEEVVLSPTLLLEGMASGPAVADTAAVLR